MHAAPLHGHTTTGQEASSTVRWQVVPATLSAALGVILFGMNCVHLCDAMIPEIGRAFDPATNFTVAHGVMCIIASTLFYVASGFSLTASYKWITNRYRAAIALLLCIPLLLAIGVFLAYLQV